MPSSFDPLLRLELQATGENRTTWGIKANNDFTLAAQAIAGHVSVNVGGLSAYSLTVAEASVDESRMASLTLSGALTSDLNLYVPAVSKNWIIRDNTTGNYTITVKTSAGDGLPLAENVNFVWCDGVSVRAASETNRVNRAGDVMTGPLSLPAGTSTSASQALRKDEIQTLVQTIVDSAISVALVNKIMLWSGSIVSIPSGWQLCDGTNGTPNLVNVFVLGAGTGVAVGATGGAANVSTGLGGDHAHGGVTGIVSLTTAQIPSHTHAVSVGDPTHAHPQSPAFITQAGAIAFGSFGGNLGTANATTSVSTGITVQISVAGGGGGHQHTIVSAGSHSHTVSVMPPYYALAYIMKLG